MKNTRSNVFPPGSRDAKSLAPMSQTVVVLLLTLLLGIQPVTTDLYLPVLPTLQQQLSASVAATQLTLSALIIAFGLGQLIAGPIADRLGRRPVLLAGLALYTCASIGGTVASSIELLIGWRVVQGIAMAAAVNCARSIIRDLFAPAEGAKVMSQALSALGLIAMICPLIGGAIAQWLNWRVALLLPGVFSVATLAFVAFKFEETIPKLNPNATRLKPLLANWLEILSDPGFRAWASISSLTFGGLFLLLASSSFIYIGVLGISRMSYGMLMAASSVAYVAGTLACRRWLLKVGLLATVNRAAWFSLAAGLGMAALSLAGIQQVWSVFVPQCIFMFGHGVHQPCSQVGAVAPFPEKAGTAASMSGFLMMLTAFLVSLGLGEYLGSIIPASLALAGFGIALTAVAQTVVQWHGNPGAKHKPAPLPASP